MLEPLLMPKYLSELDKFFLRVEDPTHLTTVSGVWIFDQPPSESELGEKLQKWVKHFPVFQHRLKNHKMWVPMGPEFDVKDHLEVSTLPQPGGKKELEECLSKEMSLPFDLEKPLWKACLFKGLNGEGAAYFIKLHHCISDGQAAIRMVLGLCDDCEPATPTPSTEKPAPPPTQASSSRTASITEEISPTSSSSSSFSAPTPAPAPATYVSQPPKKRPARPSRFAAVKKLNHELTEIVKTLAPKQFGPFITYFHPLFLATSVCLLLVEEVFFRLLIFYHFFTKWSILIFSSKKVFNRESGVRKQVAYSDLLDLEEVKEVGRITGATLNDVLISNLTSTIRNYLISTGDLEKQKEISCAVPVSVRKADDWSMGNKVCLVLLQLPIHIADPLKRLAMVKTRLDEIKASREVEFSYFGSILGLKLAPKFLQNPLVHTFTRRFHVLLTNVPGPRRQLVFCGQPIKEYYTFVPQASKGGLGVCVLSYNGKVSLSINADHGHIFPDSGGLLNEFTKEFEVLKKRVLEVYPGANDLIKLKGQEAESAKGKGKGKEREPQEQKESSEELVEEEEEKESKEEFIREEEEEVEREVSQEQQKEIIEELENKIPIEEVIREVTEIVKEGEEVIKEVTEEGEVELVPEKQSEESDQIKEARVEEIIKQVEIVKEGEEVIKEVTEEGEVELVPEKQKENEEGEDILQGEATEQCENDQVKEARVEEVIKQVEIVKEGEEVIKEVIEEGKVELVPEKHSEENKVLDDSGFASDSS